MSEPRLSDVRIAYVIANPGHFGDSAILSVMALDLRDARAQVATLERRIKELELDHEMSFGCFEMIQETLAALDQTGYDGKATPPMMLNDWARVIVARDRVRIEEAERRSAELEAALRAVMTERDCPFCDSGVLRKRVDGQEPFHANDCPWEYVRTVLAPPATQGTKS